MERVHTEPQMIPGQSPGPAAAGEAPVMVAFDIDGVILRGGSLLPGARRAIEEVLERGLLLRFVTNNSTRHRSEVAAKLAGLGLPVQADMVLTSAAATAAWLADRLPPGARVLVVGGTGLVRELADAGLDPVPARGSAGAALTQAPAAAAGEAGGALLPAPRSGPRNHDSRVRRRQGGPWSRPRRPAAGWLEAGRQTGGRRPPMRPRR